MTARASDYLMLPWTIRGPVAVKGPDGRVHYEMRVEQLPGFSATAASENELLYAFKKQLLAHLEIALLAGRPINTPNGPALRYAAMPKRRTVVGVNRAKLHTTMPIAVSSVEI